MALREAAKYSFFMSVRIFIYLSFHRFINRRIIGSSGFLVDHYKLIRNPHRCTFLSYVVWGGSRGGSGGSVEPPKPRSQTPNNMLFLMKSYNKWVNSYSIFWKWLAFVSCCLWTRKKQKWHWRSLSISNQNASCLARSRASASRTMHWVK